MIPFNNEDDGYSNWNVLKKNCHWLYLMIKICIMIMIIKTITNFTITDFVWWFDNKNDENSGCPNWSIVK